MPLKPSQPYNFSFSTRSPTGTGATNADAAPTATARLNGAFDASFALTVTNVGTGKYRISGTVPASYVAGDLVQIEVSATVSGITENLTVDSFLIDTARDSDIYSRLGAPTLATLAADIQSRSTFAGGAVASVTAPVTVATNNDKSGYSLATAPPTATQVRQELDANSTKLANLDATISSRSTFAGGAVASVTAPVVLAAGEHTAIAADVQTGLNSQGFTSARALYLDALNGLVNAVKTAIEGGILAAIKTRTDKIPNFPSSTSDVQTTVNPTLTAGQVAQLDAIAGNVAPLGSMIESGAFTAEALVNAPMGEGGGGTGGYTDEDRARDAAEFASVTAIRERLAEQVAGNGPVIALPAYTPPAGRIRVLLRPTFLGELTEATIQVFYLDKTTPVLTGGVEMVTHYATFKKDAVKFGPYYGLEMPVGDVVYFANDKNAALSKGTGAFQVTDDGTGARFLDELIASYNAD